jgi:hypothetical protein
MIDFWVWRGNLSNTIFQHHNLRPFVNHIKSLEKKRLREMQAKEAPETPPPSRVKQEAKAAPSKRRRQQ